MAAANKVEAAVVSPELSPDQARALARAHLALDRAIIKGELPSDRPLVTAAAQEIVERAYRGALHS